jgi:hypothetical protein
MGDGLSWDHLFYVIDVGMFTHAQDTVDEQALNIAQGMDRSPKMPPIMNEGISGAAVVVQSHELQTCNEDLRLFPGAQFQGTLVLAAA